MAKAKTAAMPLAVSKTVSLIDLRAGDAINARRTGRDSGLGELKASILAHGVVQSLRVRLVGESHYEVIAGNRRLLALQGLEAEGKIEPDYAVPVIVSVVDDATAHELSVVENVERVPVSPIDEFKAYGRLQLDGQSAEEVAARFGVPVRRVQQRMKLAALHPTVLMALEEGRIHLETAQAFTVAEPERQLAVFEQLSKGDGVYAYEVRRMLAEKLVRTDSKVAEMIGEAAYLAAGGEIVADLFGEHCFWSSPGVVRQLADAAWADRVKGWLADGWGWVLPESDVPDVWSRKRVYPSQVEMSDADAERLSAIEDAMEDFDTDNGVTDAEQAEWDALEGEADAIRTRYAPAFSVEVKAKSGVVYLDNGQVVFGVGEPRAGSGDADVKAEKPVLSPEDPAAVGPTVSEALSTVLTEALRTEIAADPELALPLLAAFIAAGQNGRTLPSHLSVGRTESGETDSGFGIAEAYRYFNDLPAPELLAAIARMFAQTIDVRDGYLTSSKYVSADARPRLVADLVDIVVPRVFEFDAVAYFTGVKKPLIAAAFKEITGDTIKDGKKADMADTTSKLAIEQGWLPIALRNVSYDGPGSGAGELQEAAE